MKIMLFRVDNRAFEEGEWIEPSRDYQEWFDCEEKHVLETFLENTRENCTIPRRNALFLFMELKDALLFARRSGQYIYQVQQENVYGRFDMNRLDSILEIIRIGTDKNVIEAMCRQYWHFRKTFAPCIECLTNRAKVVRIICERPEIELFSEEWLQDNSYSVEKSQTYRNLLNRIY